MDSFVALVVCCGLVSRMLDTVSLWLREILYFEHWASQNTASLCPAGKRDTVLKRTWWVCYWEDQLVGFQFVMKITVRLPFVGIPHPLLTAATRLRFKGSCERMRGIAWWSLWHCDSRVCSSQSYDLLVKCARDRIAWWTFLVFKCAQPKHIVLGRIDICRI